MTTTAPVATTAHRIAARALDWRGENHARGALPPTDTSADMTQPDRAYKPLGETALVGSLTLREGVAGPREAATAHRLLDFAWEQLRDGDLLYERQLRHPQITDPLELYAHFVRAGYRHEKLEQLLRHLHTLRSTHVVEMVPNRQLAVANAARIVGLDDHRDLPALTSATWLGTTPEPWAIDWTTAYYMTHTVFHLTDWGHARDRLPDPLPAYLRDWLPVWVQVWKEIGQWDLVGELLIVDACLSEPVCGAEDWEERAAAQHDDGLLPQDDQPLADDPDEVFTEHHHPTIVAATAGTIALSGALGGTAR
jgi:hypothetical protein